MILRRYINANKLAVRLSSSSYSGRIGMSQFPPEIEEAHRVALCQGKDTYIDPNTGYTVFTSLAAERRGKCCGKGCRHCPYGHFNVVDSKARKAPLPTKPTLLKTLGRETIEDVDGKKNTVILFWSGGKDSFLTYLTLTRTPRDIVLLTTFDADTGNVPEQNIHMLTVFDQAKALKRDLVAIPNSEPGNAGYLKAVQEGIEIALEKRRLDKENATLCFGDLHLADIRDWRAQQFGSLGYKCEFPIFKVPYDTLIEELFGPRPNSMGCKYFFSAVNKDIGHKVGDEISKSTLTSLLSTDSFDAFGENGEFHTVVQFGK